MKSVHDYDVAQAYARGMKAMEAARAPGGPLHDLDQAQERILRKCLEAFARGQRVTLLADGIVLATFTPPLEG